jgi:hypothetical protein
MDIDTLTKVAELLGLKTFGELTKEEQQVALNKKEGEVLQCLIEYPDFYLALEEQVLAAHDKAEEMQTPWFVGEYIMDEVGDEVRAIAKEAATDCIYRTDLNQEIPNFVCIAK